MDKKLLTQYRFCCGFFIAFCIYQAIFAPTTRFTVACGYLQSIAAYFILWNMPKWMGRLEKSNGMELAMNAFQSVVYDEMPGLPGYMLIEKVNDKILAEMRQRKYG